MSSPTPSPSTTQSSIPTPSAPHVSPESFFPSSQELERLEDLVPGISNRMLIQWERWLDHRAEVESRGQVFAFTVALAFLLCSFIIVMAGIITHQVAGTLTGGFIGTVDLVALVYVFITGRKQSE